MSPLLRKIYRRIVPRKPHVHPFDKLHGVDTSGLIDHSLLGSGHAHDEHNTAYWGTAPSLLRQLLARWEETLPATGPALEDYTLIDIGAGKGRVVMMASERPFRRIMGVELSPGLTRTATANLLRWKQRTHACNDLEVLQADALAVPLPAGPVLLYLFNPFGEPVMRLLLDRLRLLARDRSEPIDIIYTHPLQAALFQSVPGMQLLWEEKITFDAPDAAADIFKAVDESCLIYRLPPTGTKTP